VKQADLFVVRVWRQLAGFRASVRRVESEETQFFTRPEQVAQYLSGIGRTEPDTVGTEQHIATESPAPDVPTEQRSDPKRAQRQDEPR
jgi:hypothetical protein